MKVAIVQFDDRPLEALAPFGYLIKQNARYAALHGYEYALITKLGIDVPPFWAKPHIVMFYLKAGYDAVLWLDTDAVVHDLECRIETFFRNDEAFVFASDNPVWRSPFNAGVFMCKGPRGLDLMREWIALYREDLWENIGQQWSCKDRRWAGPAYEQGSFVVDLMPKYAGSGLLRQLEWDVLQSPFPLKNSFTLHFADRFKANIGIYSAQPTEKAPALSRQPADHSPTMEQQVAKPYVEVRTN